VKTIQSASLDTSFWTIGYHAEVLPYLFDYFKIFVAPEVEDEILARDVRFPNIVYGYSKLYEVFKEDKRFQIVSPQSRLGQFGHGEDAAISLALEHNWMLLINDVRPHARGISTVSVPAFVVLLLSSGTIHRSAAEAKLQAIQYNTSQALLDNARNAIAALIS
jgi:predicted nucleic acid-binding protein